MSMHSPLRHVLHAALLASFLLASNAVTASGLQVAPVSLSLAPSKNADGLWLSNTGDGIVHAQVRVYHWTQQGGEEQLTPSRGLIISPPMMQLAIGDKQMVRVIRVGAPPSGVGAAEDAYRVTIDELPIDTQGKKGLQFVLHYSVPVFVEPAGAAAVAPQLQWNLQRDGDHVVLQVANTGTGHAQLAQVSYVDNAGHRTEISGGLLGYVLPGATMHWTLKQPTAVFAGGGTLEAMINGAKATQKLPLADRAHLGPSAGAACVRGTCCGGARSDGRWRRLCRQSGIESGCRRLDVHHRRYRPVSRRHAQRQQQRSGSLRSAGREAVGNRGHSAPARL